ncbi:amidohydrolase family protein [Novosphingobium sp. ERN07]|uniref:amidohydrolase n=1 Tax=Novosphingobium sp. ERN07 TaxID=2726187 RepID=UPI00145666CE|nr:amidohydrolase [Novosphingobium sp. ERN07]NLR70442.1 amidohydrolase family protein [Novosphingobium sp. ERN07]
MRKPLRLTLLATSLLTIAAPSTAQFKDAVGNQPPVPADVIYVHGHVSTPAGWQEAIAVSGSTIVGTGSKADLAKHRTATTKVIDLEGRTVLPGLIDMHVHAVDAGLQANNCIFPQGAAMATAIATVKACAAKARPGAWIEGGQWDGSSLGKAKPTAKLLDAVAPANPVVLHDISLHSVWVNSAALKQAGITRDTPNPAGGVIERDAKGNPTGVLRETAAIALLNKVPAPSEEERIAALDRATHAMLAQGITAYEEALMASANAKIYAALADRGRLVQYVRTCMWDNDQDLIAQRQIYARPRLDLGCVKMILDGVPTDAHTAAMLEPYADADHALGPERQKGSLIIDAPSIIAKITRYDAVGLTVKLHAAGDASVRAALDGIAAARKANGGYGPHHEIAHANFIAPEDVARAAQLGATYEFSPYLWFPSPPVRDVVTTVGPKRMERFTPVRDAQDAGARVVMGSDWPVIPSMSPWVAIETLVTRQAPGGSAEVLSPSQRVSVADAVTMLTTNAARQLGIGHITGSIEPGKQADFIVIDRDIFAVAPTQIHQTRVLRTVVGGKDVYSAQ